MRQYKLSELAQILGGGTPKTSRADYWDGDIPWLSVVDFNNNFRHVFSTEKTITEAGLNNSSTQILYPGDIIISARGTVGALAQVAKKMAFNQSCYGLRARPEIACNDYLFYLLRHSIETIKKNTHGSVFDTITRDTFESIAVDLPDLITQQKIASILTAFDDKIELNAQINHNLEELAKAIFNSWFVDLEPFSRIIPKTWKEGVLGNFVEIKRGASPRPIQDFISSKGFRWLKISDATACDSPFLIEIKEHIKESGLSKTVFLQAGALVLSNSATPGIPKILDVDSCIHDGWLYFPKSQLSKEFLFLFFQNIRPKLVLLGNGSVFTNLKTDILKTLPFSLPDKETLANFDRVILPIFEQIKNNSRESYRLAQMRDTLLPKLMSGEIDVSEVEISQKNSIKRSRKYAD